LNASLKTSSDGLRALLDLNVLIAMFDEEHIHYVRAHQWWAESRADGWASCPLTQNGFVRVLSRPSYSNHIPIFAALALLSKATAQPDHTFWPDDISVVDSQHFDNARLLGPKQLTDVYLLALAVKNGGRLVTLDRTVSLAVVRGAEPRHVVVI
jgi:toxin-antitoxin system PIN domain toxin